MASMAIKAILLAALAALAGAQTVNIVTFAGLNKTATLKQLQDIDTWISRQSVRLARVQNKSNIYKNDTLFAQLSADSEKAKTNINDALDCVWFVLCGTLVMFMQAGFACVEAGSCRFKNVQSVLLKNLSDVCVGTIGFWAFGWAFAYGTKNSNF